MQSLNEAYEVLTDPGMSRPVLKQRKSANEKALRQRYDNGDDPNDPHAGQQHNPFAHHGGGGNPFQFFQQQGGGGGQGFPFQGGQKFKFEF